MARIPALLAAIAAALLSIAACQKGSDTQPTPLPCAFTLSESTLTFGASGGSATITVTTRAGCDWSAQSDHAWMSIVAGASGSGPGAVQVAVAANPSTIERTGTLTIADKTVAVRVDALATEPCTVDLQPSSASIGADAATGSFAVTTPSHCEWSARSSASWLTITAGAQGTGSGTVAYAVDRNAATASRSGGIAVGARTFLITQAGSAAACDYSVAPVEIAVCMSLSSELTTTLTTQPGCTWTAESAASWLTLQSAASGNGPATVRFTVSDNWDAPRLGVLMLRWPTVTAGQNVRVSQAGCRYAVSTSSIAAVAAGGAYTFDVIQQSDPLECGGPLQNGCVWSAVSNAPWITVTSSMPRRGDDRVTLQIAANDSTAPRSGSVSVRDRAVQIVQSGR